MSDPNYQRTSRYRNWMNKRMWLPIVKGALATMASGAQYIVRKEGWRRIYPQVDGSVK